MAYVVREIFRTLQGEGVLSGTPMVFVRFAGCNLWSGRECDRERDAARHHAACPVFCDTDFAGGDRMDAAELLARVAAQRGPRWICFTGGEPMLQLDRPLLQAARERGYHVALETNGTLRLDAVRDALDWVCVSPKLPKPNELAVLEGDELKLVYSGQPDPEIHAWEALRFRHFALQPEWGPRYLAHLEGALAFLQTQPRWRLSLQTHKIIGLP